MTPAANQDLWLAMRTRGDAVPCPKAARGRHTDLAPEAPIKTYDAGEYASGHSDCKWGTPEFRAGFFSENPCGHRHHCAGGPLCLRPARGKNMITPRGARASGQ